MASLQTVPKLALRVTRGAFDIAIGVAGSALDRLTGGGDDGDTRAARPAPAPAPRPAPSPEAAAPRPVTPPAPRVPPSAQPAPPPAPAPPPPEPDELVAEFADPGAEAGAGPEIHVDEPWPGYDGMTVPAISDRLVACDAAQIAAVELYEAANRNRKSVVEAARRQLARSG